MASRQKTSGQAALHTGRGSVRLERTVRDREVGGSNPPAPTRDKKPSESTPTMYYTYILQSETTGRYYTGSTSDVENRVSEHNTGETKSTRSGIPWKVVYVETYPTRSEAERKERQIKARGARRYLEDIIHAEKSSG